MDLPKLRQHEGTKINVLKIPLSRQKILQKISNLKNFEKALESWRGGRRGSRYFSKFSLVFREIDCLDAVFRYLNSTRYAGFGVKIRDISANIIFKDGIPVL